MRAKKFLLLTVAFYTFASSWAQQPNIVLFLVDDLGWRDISGYGSALYQTPNVDALAQSGVKFTDAYSACTVCSPSRASILTGKYPARIRCTDWIAGHNRPYAKLQIPVWTQRLLAADTTLAEVLKTNGYRTAHIGKWHLGEEETDWPEYHGFDLNIGGWKKGQPNKVNKQGGFFTPYNNPRLMDGPPGEYLTERLAREAADYIQQNKDTPFFLNYWLYSVHTPMEAKEEKIKKYRAIVHPDSLQANATYAAMVEHMDDALGQVVAALKDAGVYENTIVIFASDNGGLLSANDGANGKTSVTSNHPLRSGKGDVYEGAVRTPLIISWPKEIAGGRVTNVPSISTDIFPTVLGLTGLRKSFSSPKDGVDLSALLLKNKKPKRDAIFWHYPHYHTEGATPYSAVRQGDWKLIKFYEDNRLELYNLETDIGETTNLVDRQSKRAVDMHQLLQEWLQEVAAQLPEPNPDYDPAKVNKWN